MVLKAVAKLVYDFAFSPRREEGTADQNLEKLLSGISDLDFAHSEPMWRYYEYDEHERSLAKLALLEKYLPASDDKANRDVGSFQTGFMRFGAKHNDIYPLLGDMMRWRLGLPARSHKS